MVLEEKFLSGMMLIVLFNGMLTFAFDVKPVKATGTIYIKADGSIEPPTAPIRRVGDLYIITDDIYEPIVIQRDNMTLDGNGFTIQGGGEGHGIELAGRNNVTIVNVAISKFTFGIYVSNSSKIKLLNNVITNNSWGGRYWYREFYTL